ncbi:DUF3887 domain-containing protein [Agriterribacter humi]|uniref:DUF3887 domain-containing protein n=1 Tax=Agriterribacter humi TaxID=1104781 RepID=UPI0012640919|nr:hypothetical protein [Agriterribacter humi]
MYRLLVGCTRHYCYVVLICGISLFLSCYADDLKAALKHKAGKANELVNLDRYEEIRAMMSESLKQKITQQLFDNVDSTTKAMIGEFVHPIDTSETTVNGVVIWSVRNQYLHGIRTTTFQFDESGLLVHMFSIPAKN